MTVTTAAYYFEDIEPGLVVEHRRGHSVCTADNQLLSLLTMNTAQTHFNRDSLSSYMDGAFPEPLLNACVALALAVGLTTDDLSANALADLGYAEFRMPAPVFVGDSLYAASEVVEVADVPDRADAGGVTYRITARCGDTTVLTVRRHVLIKRRSHWLARDEEFLRAVHAAGTALLGRG
ncbi:hypothetical protein GCM10009836_36530 [Pseudonocardia ailaonensis]|uniref:Acyl dehydratase n=1 Tax=Pseudonocardia ailaonensis TaxID=367279 RepID=A0ABN2N537_9PSEU